jgi:ankyrin repeat protein
MNQLNVIEALLFYDTDYNATDRDGNTALHHFVSHGDKTAVARLLGYKDFKVNARNRNGETALYIACEKGLQDIVGLLINSGANNNSCGTRIAQIPKSKILPDKHRSPFYRRFNVV